MQDELIVRIAEIIEECFPERGVDVVALRAIQTISGLSASLRYLVGQESCWQRRLAKMGLGVSSFIVKFSPPDVEGKRAGRALSTSRTAAVPSRTVRQICRHGPPRDVVHLLQTNECPACTYALRKSKPAKTTKTPQQVKDENIRLRLTHVHAHLFPVGGIHEDPLYYDTVATMKLRTVVKSAKVLVRAGGQKTFAASEKLGDHPPIYHSFATQPPVTELTVGRIIGFDDRIEDYDQNGWLTGASMSVSNPMGVTILDLMASWFD